MTTSRDGSPVSVKRSGRTGGAGHVLARFVAQDSRPDTVADIDVEVLSPYHRCLLLSDGTVTNLLEAYALEPTRTRCLAQAMVRPSREHRRWLDLAHDTDVLLRRVVIEGDTTGLPLVYATSALLPSRLPADFLSMIGSGGGSIGTALLSSKVESRREMLWCGRRADAVASRQYRIFVRGRPALVINEDFVQ
jgi:chorismate-pyruvate lyase